MEYLVKDNEADLELIPIESLSQRENEILALLAENQSNRRIADELVLSINTIKWYVRQIYAKLGVSNRQQAVTQARELGLLAEVNPKHNLPSPLTPFIRRTEENPLVDLITAQDTRLLTIIGMGGVGKTRLVIQVANNIAQQRLNQFPDGICFVSLAALSDPDSIPLAIAESLNLAFFEDQGDPRQQLVYFLSRKHLLLILDCFEHLLEGAEFVSEILRSAPGLKVVTTSREPLNMHAERIFEVRGLQYPEDELSSDIGSYPAVSLFFQRAKNANLDFTMDEAQKKCVLRICKLVQGMPLAIELAAGWISTLSCEEIADEIEASIDILQGELRDVPARQKSIRAVFEYSWVSLSGEERKVLMKSSVFTGGFTRRASVYVCGASTRILSNLVRKSLIWRAENGLYEMHDLIRQFVEEKLVLSGRFEEVRNLHAEYYADMLKQLETDLKGNDQVSALYKIGLNLSNIRTAWDWATRKHKYEIIDNMLDSFYLYCVFRRGQFDGLMMLKKARDKLAKARQPVFTRVLARLSVRYEMLNIDKLRVTNPDRIENSRAVILACLEAAQRNDEQAEIAFCLHALGRSLSWTRDFSEAISIFERTIEYCDQIGDDFYKAYSYYRIGFCSHLMGNLEQARESNETGLLIARKTGNDYVAAWILDSQGLILHTLGQIDKADEYLREEIQIRERLGDKQGIAWATAYLGLMTFFQGQFQDAKKYSLTAIEYSEDINYQAVLGLAYSIHGWILAGLGDYTTARSYSEKALELYTVSTVTNYGIAKFALAYSTCLNGDIQLAKVHYCDAIREFQHIGNEHKIVSSLVVMAVILAREGKYVTATELLALALNHPVRLRGWVERELLVDELMTILHKAMDAGDFARAWDHGKQLEYEMIVENFVHGNL
jgi:predicted ATPase/DNA-binding CsgD family transcriptional regulator